VIWCQEALTVTTFTCVARFMRVGESVAKPVMNNVHNIVFDVNLYLALTM